MAQNWFQHDYNAKNDEKILELRAMHGWEGYGLFYAFIETMCENETGYIDTKRIGGLSIGYNTPKDTLLAFINDCLEIGLFIEDEDGMITNKRVQEHVAKMEAYSEAGKKGAKKRWNKQSDRGANRGANAGVYADKIREDKNREEDKEDSGAIPSLSEVKEYFIQNGYKEEVAEKAYNIYNASIEDHPKRKYWRDSRDNLIKNWKLKMQSVWFKDENKIAETSKVIDGGLW